MHKKKIRLIIIFTSISLTGLIFMQLYWIQNAVKLSEKQFGHRVDLALSEVVNALKKDKSDTIAYDNILKVIKINKLDHLLNKYFNYHHLAKNFDYSIIRYKYDSTIYTSNKNINFKIKHTYKVCLSCLWSKDYYYLQVVFPNQKKVILYKMKLWILLSGLFLLIVIIAFSANIWAIIKQKRIAEIKNDFVNNMTHELKTPISTISIASEILINSKENQYKNRIAHYSKIIYDENQKMKQQVDQVLQMALLDKEGFSLNKTEVDIHELIRDTIQSMCLDRCKKPVHINYKFNATNIILNIDTIHISNIISNLVENAYKYSQEKVKIQIETKDADKGFIFSVADNGNGISSDAQKNIFDKFYRVPTGNIHNVKGFGLGLYYVKIMVEAHKGHISVDSKTGKGTKFEIFLPY